MRRENRRDRTLLRSVLLFLAVAAGICPGANAFQESPPVPLPDPDDWFG